MNSMTLTAATTHSAMATAAVAVPGLAPMLSQLIRLAACEILANHVGSARRATRPRYSTAFSAVEEQRSGPAPVVHGEAGPAAAGRKAPPGAARPVRGVAQVSHCSTCPPTRSLVCSVSCPSQSVSNSPSTGQVSRPVQHDEQGREGFLQPATGACGQGVRPARRHAECLSQIGAMQVMPEAQLDDLTLPRPQLGQDGTGQGPEPGLRGVAVGASRRARGRAARRGPAPRSGADAGIRCEPPRTAMGAARGPPEGCPAWRRR